MRFKKTIAVCIVALFGCKIFCGCYNYVQTSPREIYSVVLDAGHGGIDGGVTGVKTGVKESDVNLFITKALAETFKNAGFKVTLTRDSEAGLYGNISKGFKKRDMQRRAEIIRQANPTLVISIHQNKFLSSSRRGTQVYYQTGNLRSKAFAEKLQTSFNAMPSSVRGCNVLSGDYYVIKVLPCPSVIIECGFLSNAEDEQLLLSEEYRKELTNAVLEGTLNYLASL